MSRNIGPPPETAFRLARSIPLGPWGDKGTPWTRHRYVLALSKLTAASPTFEENVTTPAREFLQARNIALLALEELQRRFREPSEAGRSVQSLRRFATTDAPKVLSKG